MTGAEGEDAFARGFYPDFDKDAMIIDVRHNTGGNIDSWLLSALERKAWMYFQGRATNITTGGLGWNEQFAFRGHVVVLIDEKTSSDGEGFARGISELGLGKIVGTRTWGGGIWLSSDNRLVDNGITSAPEYGTYNNNFGWGIGIEQMGVEPDVKVDNNPRLAYDGEDQQLEIAINVLKQWINEDPILLPKNPETKKDMSLDKSAEACDA
jgi:tricorn protease